MDQSPPKKIHQLDYLGIENTRNYILMHRCLANIERMVESMEDNQKSLSENFERFVEFFRRLVMPTLIQTVRTLILLNLM